MSKNIKSFAAFLEQTERKAEKANLPRAESAPGTEIVLGADLVPHPKTEPRTNIAPHAEVTPHEDSASDVKAHSEPVRKARDAVSASRAEIAPVRGHLRVPNEILYNILPTLKPSEAIVL